MASTFQWLNTIVFLSHVAVSMGAPGCQAALLHRWLRNADIFLLWFCHHLGPCQHHLHVGGSWGKSRAQVPRFRAAWAWVLWTALPPALHRGELVSCHSTCYMAGKHTPGWAATSQWHTKPVSIAAVAQVHWQSFNNSVPVFPHVLSHFVPNTKYLVGCCPHLIRRKWKALSTLLHCLLAPKAFLES